MLSIFGIDISNIPEHHRQFLISLFYNKKESVSRKKEFQSAVIFFTQFPETTEIAENWKKNYAPNLNTSALLKILKYLTKKLNLHLHRFCKTTYPVMVYISHYYNVLKPYLESIFYVDTIEVHAAFLPQQQPFSTLEQMIIKQGYERQNLYNASIRLASILAYFYNTKMEYVIVMKDPSGTPFFIAIRKVNNKYLSITKEDVEKNSLPIIQAIPQPIAQDISFFPSQNRYSIGYLLNY